MRINSNCVGGAAVARRSHKPEVVGSNPTPATTIRSRRADPLRWHQREASSPLALAAIVAAIIFIAAVAP